MGILLRQSFWSTIVIYLGVVLGFVNSIILFPKFLSTEQIGLVRQIISAATLLIPITTFGVNSTYVKFYPIFMDNKNQKNQFFIYELIVIIICYSIVFIFLNIFFESISNLFTDKSALLFQYFDVFLLILFSLSISTLFESYLKARYDTVLNNIINGVSNRLLTAISILLFSSLLINFDQFIYLQALIYSIGVIVLIIYAYQKEKFKLNFNLDNIKYKLKEIFNYSSFAFIGSFSNIIVLNIDVLMVTSILGLSDTGIYTTAFYIGMIIEIPRRAISQISTPFISENIKKNDFKKIEKNYKDVSIHQMIIGILFYIILILNIDNIFNIIPNAEKFYAGKDIVYIIGLSKLIIMSFSYNSELISLSRYYKFTVITIICLAILTIGLNLILIPKFGMIGAAYASLISITFYNLLKHTFIIYKMEISPFSINSLKTIAVGVFVYLIVLFIPENKNILFDLIIKTISSAVIFLVFIFLLKVSPELNKIIKEKIRS
jgi:O-antigen/teichoic acid export membrane protein